MVHVCTDQLQKYLMIDTIFIWRKMSKENLNKYSDFGSTQIMHFIEEKIIYCTYFVLNMQFNDIPFLCGGDYICVFAIDT